MEGYGRRQGVNAICHSGREAPEWLGSEQRDRLVGDGLPELDGGFSGETNTIGASGGVAAHSGGENLNSVKESSVQS